MIPIRWIARCQLPECVARFQNCVAGCGATYEKKGLRYLRKRQREEYDECVDLIANAIVNAADQHPLPIHPETPVLNEVDDAFLTVEPAPGAAPVETTTAGPRFAQFVFVVGAKQDLSAHRANVACYGDMGAPDWRPFAPNCDEPVMLTAQQAALDQKLYYESLTFNPDIRDELVNRVREAERANKIVVILLDVWTLRLDDYRAIMQLYDEVQFFNSAVIIPWNSHDTEDNRQQQALESELKTALFRQPGTVLKTNVPSRDKLLEQLSVVLNERRNSIVEFTNRLRESSGQFARPLPLVSAAQDE